MIEGLWLVRVMSVGGPTLEAIPRFFPPRFLWKVTGLLSGGAIPVGFDVQDDEIVHPLADAAAIAACQIGRVAHAWFDWPSASLLAVLEIESAEIECGLERLDRARRLQELGVSIVLDHVRAEGLEYVDATRALSLDFVTRPVAPGACVLESITYAGRANRSAPRRSHNLEVRAPQRRPHQFPVGVNGGSRPAHYFPMDRSLSDATLAPHACS